jgi:hypothetical protein
MITQNRAIFNFCFAASMVGSPGLEPGASVHPPRRVPRTRPLTEPIRVPVFPGCQHVPDVFPGLRESHPRRGLMSPRLHLAAAHMTDPHPPSPSPLFTLHSSLLLKSAGLSRLPAVFPAVKPITGGLPCRMPKAACRPRGICTRTAPVPVERRAFRADSSSYSYPRYLRNGILNIFSRLPLSMAGNGS